MQEDKKDGDEKGGEEEAKDDDAEPEEEEEAEMVDPQEKLQEGEWSFLTVCEGYYIRGETDEMD